MRDRLQDALKKSTADYAEIRFELNESTSIRCRGNEVDDVSASRLSRGIVRACTNGGWGQVQFDDLEQLPEYVQAACAAAAAVGRERTELAEPGSVADGDKPARLDRDFRGVPVDEKLGLVTGLNEILLGADPRIETSTVVYKDLFRTVSFASTRGAWFREERPYVTLALFATARDGNLVQQAHDSVSSARTYEVVTDLEPRAAETAKRAAALLDAPACEAGRHTVVLGRKLGGVFAHEAFGHLSEADFLYENPKMRELMQRGRTMGGRALNIIDDGSMPGHNELNLKGGHMPKYMITLPPMSGDAVSEA